MHKTEASNLFKVLADENNVKMMKILFNNDFVEFDLLANMVGISKDTLEKNLKITCECSMTVIDHNNVIANKPLIEELMSFIKTPCSCSKK